MKRRPEYKKEPLQVTKENISYYNEIASGYDALMNEDVKNALIRTKVAATFTALVRRGDILDFGGGTGRDLSWLLKDHYRVFFCEPSISMRQIAIDRVKREYPSPEIVVLTDKKTDFRNWCLLYPFEQKLNAVLANFAVFNCIPDIEVLFGKLALVLESGGIVLALILNNSLWKQFQTSFIGSIKSFIFGGPVKFSIEFNGKHQFVFIHSMRSIRRAAGGYFTIIRTERLNEFGFCLIHLVRK